MTCSFASFLISSRIFGKKATELEIVTKFVSLSGRYFKEVFLLQIARKEVSECFFFTARARMGAVREATSPLMKSAVS